MSKEVVRSAYITTILVLQSYNTLENVWKFISQTSGIILHDSELYKKCRFPTAFISLPVSEPFFLSNTAVAHHEFKFFLKLVAATKLGSFRIVKSVAMSLAPSS